MKKTISFLLASTFLLTSIPCLGTESPSLKISILSQSVTSPESDFTFKNGKITQYNGAGGDVVIPSTINGEPVTSLSSYSFTKCKTLTSVVIPDSVTTIDGSAFGGAFAFCTALTSVVIPDSVTLLGDATFYDCTSLTTVNLPSQLMTLSSRLFGGCTSLSKIELPTSLLTIEDRVFKGCVSLEQVTIPDKVAELGYSLFSGCTKLKSITIPKSVTTIGANLVYKCDDFTTVYYNGEITDKEKISLSSTFNGNFLDAEWIYESSIPEETPQIEKYPDWATTFIDFISPTIMPDISVHNYTHNCSRGLIAQSLYHLAGNGEIHSENPNFTDLGAYSTAISWCQSKSIMTGTSDTTFGTEGNLTREQVALILMNLSNTMGIMTIPSDASVFELFEDVDDISEWALHGMAWCVANGLMSGSNNKLNPSGYITRTEVAVMLYHFDKL